MKNIFKFMAIALVSSSMLFACGDKDNENDNNNNNNGDNNGGNNTPTASYKITWDGQVQNLGFMEAYKYSSSAQSCVYVLMAAQGLENEDYVRPAFTFGFDLDANPQYGCTLTAHWVYGDDQVNGNTYWPTSVAVEGWYNNGAAYVGDWWLNYYDEGWDGHLTDAQFDANTRTLTATVTEQMFCYTDVADYYETNGIEEPTNADFLAGLTAAEKKELKLEMTNLVFDAASQK